MIAASGLHLRRGKRRILSDVNIEAPPGSLVTISGESGAGKSTLMNAMASLLTIESGRLIVCDLDISRPSARLRRRFLREYSGFVFQSPTLVPWLTAQENVAVGIRYRGIEVGPGASRNALEQVGLGERTDSRPHELSGGERQRVAIARAVVGRPRIIFADEPTGNLDPENGAAILNQLRVATKGTTLVIVTHEPSLARLGTHRWVVADGTVISEPRS